MRITLKLDNVVKTAFSMADAAKLKEKGYKVINIEDDRKDADAPDESVGGNLEGKAGTLPVAEKDNKTADGARANRSTSGNKNKNTPNLQPDGEPKQEDIDSENETPSSDEANGDPKPEDNSGENKEVPPNDSKDKPKPEDKPSDKK